MFIYIPVGDDHLGYALEHTGREWNHACESILSKLREMDFAMIQEQGFMPLYRRDSLTDALHEIGGFRTDYEFITKQQMKTIQKMSKGR